MCSIYHEGAMKKELQASRDFFFLILDGGKTWLFHFNYCPAFLGYHCMTHGADALFLFPGGIGTFPDPVDEKVGSHSTGCFNNLAPPPSTAKLGNGIYENYIFSEPYINSRLPCKFSEL